ncbi:MAG: peptide chain release factor 1 [Deltaproteobacteria bacterium]|nr:peptide chain release factor 1 [Deltaproteobacteria bacterium]
MFNKLDEVEQRYHELDSLLSDPAVFEDRKKYQSLTSERAKVAPIIESYQRYKAVEKQLDDNRALLDEEDDEIKELAREDIAQLTVESDALQQELQLMLLPKDPRDEKNVILEIRAGTGGDEAALFAVDLFRMYSKFAEQRGWKVDILSRNLTGLKGAKEIIALIEGKGAYSQFRFESGVHRVQRVPETETQGRIHTSAVTVAVLPEAADVDIAINPADLKFDVYRSSGPGGQSVNTTDSAVRITHLPTGMIVSNQDEKSQHKNKAKALKVLKSRLLDLAVQKQHSEISQERKSMVGSGDRSERIRTYNFPQGRVTDHRINLTLYKLENILMGDVQEVIDSLVTHYQAEALKAASAPVV